jgi:hypothetical protein
MMTEIRVIDDGQEQYPAQVLWTARVDGDYVALLSMGDAGYLFAKRRVPFVDDGDTPLIPPLDYDDRRLECFELGRPEAGQLAVALITAVINNSDQLIEFYTQQRMAR